MSPRTLRPYQQDSLEKLWDHFQSGQSRALVVMATGLGKTVLVSAFTKRWLSAHGGRVLVLAHTRDIVRQNRDEFGLWLGRDNTGIVISGETENPDARALFTTFQSMEGRLGKVSRTEFSLVIIDEAHHGQAMTYRRVIEHFIPQFSIGITATPDRMDGLDIRELFGEEILSYPLERGIAEGWLVDVNYRLLIDNVSRERLQTLVAKVRGGFRKIKKNEIDGSIFLPERLEVIAEIIKKERRTRRKAIIFCRSVAHVCEVAKFFPGAAPYHSSVPKGELRTTLQEFKQGRITTLLVVDKFNEGVDVPDADLMVFLRATNSKTIWLQQLGRGLRIAPGKQDVLILDFVANCDRILMVQLFSQAINVICGPTDPRSPIRLTGTGWTFSFDEIVRDIFSILEGLKQDLYATYEEARDAARTLCIRTSTEYGERFQEHPRLPSSPWVLYKDDWTDWSDFLGTDRPDLYTTYKEAQDAVRALGIRTATEYKARHREDSKLPSNPHRFYKDEWVSWPDFLGTSSKPKRKATSFYPTLAEARKAVRRLGIRSTREYRRRYSEDSRLPSNPEVVYKDEWQGFRRSFLYYLTLAKASRAAQGLGFRTQVDYLSGRDQDPCLPGSPNLVYKADWKGWSDFFGTGRVLRKRSEVYGTYAEAQKAARALGVKTSAQYRAERPKDPKLPGNPKETYKADWISWPEFLGVKRVRRRKPSETYATYEEAQRAVQALGIKTTTEYTARRKEDPKLPSNPRYKYKDVWVSWPDFFGTRTK